MTDTPSEILRRVESASTPAEIEISWTSRSDRLETNKKILKKVDGKILEKLKDDADEMSVKDLISFKDSAAKQIAILEGDSIDPNGPKVIPANIVINVVWAVHNN